MPAPDRVRKGDPITSAWANSLRDAVAALESMRGGDGISVSRSQAGLIIAMAAVGNGLVVPALVTDVQGVDGDRIDTVKYKAQPLGEGPTAETDFVSPKYGRVYADTAAVRTARAGDLCAIVRAPKDDGTRTADLWIFTELVLGRRCGPAPAPGATGAARKLVAALPFTGSAGAGEASSAAAPGLS